jgi:CRISPR-associated protein Csb2
MPMSILVKLRGGRYDAGGERPSQSEWPPHPARVFCALAASAESESDWEALQWLEQQGSPQVWADPVDRVYTSQARAYVVQNAVERGGGNLTWPGRTNGLRTRACAVPASESFAIVWPQTDPPADSLSRLNLLAWKVPYVGRSTSAAQVAAIGSLPADMPGALVYEPAELGEHGRFWDLRIPYAGYTDALRDAYADGRRSWEVARTRAYSVLGGRQREEDRITAEPPAAAGPFADLLIWGIERPVVRVGGDLVVNLTSALRRAVLARVSEPVPGQVSGHTDPGRPHVAFLVLPDVGHDHADGHVLGLALAIPEDMPDEHLTVLLRGVLLGEGLKEVRWSTGRPLAVRYGPGRGGLRAARWMTDGGEREWVTVTPVMLDGHVRRGRDEASEVARSLVIAGYPEPAEVEVSSTPMVAGGIWRPRAGTLPPRRPRRQIVHARVRFHQPVTGPVLAGSMRYLGLGLFLPASHRPSRRPVQPPTDQQATLAPPGGTAARARVEVAG